MALEIVTTLSTFGNGTELDYIERDGQILFTAEEIGKHLGYGSPAEAVNRLYKRNQKELKHYSTSVKLTAVDGKLRETRAFVEEGVYILSMLARTNEAKRFRARVALLLRRIRKQREEHLIELARTAGFEAARKKFEPKIDNQWLDGHETGFEEGRAEGLQAVLSLSKKQNSIIAKALQYRKQGFSGKEIGCLLGCSSSTVLRALKKLEAL